jgi:branched-chain amino acid transport system substrate-binding protein
LEGPGRGIRLEFRNMMMLFPFRRRLLGLVIAALCVPVPGVLAQEPAQPYAVLNRDAVEYNGPGREAGNDLTGPEIKIGLLVPRHGPRQSEGDRLLLAAQLALEDESGIPLPGGRRLRLVARDETGLWGRASTEIVDLVFDDRAAALITTLDGASAHLAEQVGNKVGVPILTLSTDQTTTQINLPWIFRLGPADASQACLFAHDIYSRRGLKKVALLTEGDHDGRVGGEEFEKAARNFTRENSTARGVPPTQTTAPPPVRMAVDPARPIPDSLVNELREYEALVVWTGPEVAARLIPRARDLAPSLPIYLCRKAAQGWVEDWPQTDIAPNFWSGANARPEDGGTWLALTRPGDATGRESFERRYRERLGVFPTAAAAQAYDAVRILASTLRRAGPNRARLRDALAQLAGFPGITGVISFDHAGNDLTQVSLVRLR